MECPNCGDRNTTVKDSRKVEMNVFRTRHYNKCGNTFYTEEISIDDEETCRFIIEQYTRVLCNRTRLMSKPTYYARDVISQIDDWYDCHSDHAE